MTKILLALFFVLCVVSSGSAANHYVRPGAGGSNNGNDWTNAYTAIPGALTRGDTYYLADGTYGAYDFDDANSGTTRITIKKATVADHGVGTGWSDAYGDGEAVFTNSGADVWMCSPSVGYITIDGQFGTHGTAGSFGIRVTTTASRNGANALFKIDTGGPFGSSGNCDNWIVKNVEFDWNNGTSTGSSGAGRCVELNSGLTNDNFTFDHVWCHHSSGFGFYINSGGDGLTIKNSRFSDNGGESSFHHETLWLNPGSNLTFTGNELIDSKNGAITGWLMIGNMSTALVANNIFYCTNTAACELGGNGVVATWSSTGANSNITIANNTFVNLPTDGPFINFSYGCTSCQCRNNLVYSGAFGWDGCGNTTHNACGGGATCSGTNAQTGITTSIFSNYAAKDLHLTGHTAAGFAMSSYYSTDRDAVVRTFWDRGAYEYGADTTAPSIPTNLQAVPGP